ncbi:unnamed protein product [Protopolystoma xenopodis]|uniref:Uncharacterized protein n=1 Tax=Protopolystoma xenopodis TaxID=117903 RepID=A0A448X6F0_9PLAT|nr:unnamed protein product [Protopolystoma xenopodis]
MPNSQAIFRPGEQTDLQATGYEDIDKLSDQVNEISRDIKEVEPKEERVKIEGEDDSEATDAEMLSSCSRPEDEEFPSTPSTLGMTDEDVGLSLLAELAADSINRENEALQTIEVDNTIDYPSTFPSPMPHPSTSSLESCCLPPNSALVCKIASTSESNLPRELINSLGADDELPSFPSTEEATNIDDHETTSASVLPSTTKFLASPDSSLVLSNMTQASMTDIPLEKISSSFKDPKNMATQVGSKQTRTGLKCSSHDSVVTDEHIASEDFLSIATKSGLSSNPSSSLLHIDVDVETSVSPNLDLNKATADIKSIWFVLVKLAITNLVPLQL